MNLKNVLAIITTSSLMGFSTNNITPKSRGTVIFAAILKNQILLAADSRTQWVSSEGIQYTEDNMKIFRTGNIFFECAGLTGFGKESASQIIKANYNHKLSIATNTKNINRVLKQKLSDYVHSLTSKDLEILAQGNKNEAEYINFFIAGYEKNKPIISNSRITIEKVNDVYEVINDEIQTTSKIGDILVVGNCSHIRALLNEGFQWSTNRLNDFISLIKYESARNEMVNANVNFVIISSKDHEYGKNY